MSAVPSPTTGRQKPTGTVLPVPQPSISQQFEITAKDNGKTVVYTITSRFSLILDQQQYPKEAMKVTCQPAGVVGSISNVPPVAPPLWITRYEGVEPGECTVTDRDFSVTIRIVGNQTPANAIERRPVIQRLRDRLGAVDIYAALAASVRITGVSVEPSDAWQRLASGR